MTDLDPTIARLAAAFDIATEFWDWQGAHTTVPEHTIVAVLAAIGVDASTPDAAAAAADEHELAPWRRMLPAFLAVTRGRSASVPVHVRHGDPVTLRIELESGGERELSQLENLSEPREVDGVLTGEASFELPSDLPLGYHELRAESPASAAAMPLVVTPAFVGLPASMGDTSVWGLATQLYSVRSRQSWGVGDLTDLADLATWSAAEHGAGYVLVNPLHAAEPVPPIEPSPYLPTSRRFANPLYLRIEAVPEYATATDEQRQRIDALRGALADSVDGVDRIERDAAWQAKRAALSILFAVSRTPGREIAFAAYRRREGQGLVDFATWCALAEVHGPTYPQWPEELRHPRSEAVDDFAVEHAVRVSFFCFLQWLLDEQLASAQQSALTAGMPLGVMHDLAVGVQPRGADAWSMQDSYATGITVGAPPDAYNQNGQDWRQRPWRPDRLAEEGYAPFREMVSTILRHAGGIRVDHIIGLFRLWWIPDGAGPKDGTYVRYDHEAMIGILALEAHRAQAVVVGEDLGTVEPWVRDYLRDRGILGTSVLWFEHDLDADDGDAPLPAERWREYCLASVTTHDLPPTAAYLAGDHVRLRESLGLLTRPLDEELAIDASERAAWLDVLRERGLLPDDADEEATVRALHCFLTSTPSRLLSVALTDAVGDRRAQNQPGTRDEYPNWRVPLTGPDRRPLLLEDVFASARAAALLEVFG